MSTPGSENDPLLDDRFEGANRAVDTVARTLRDIALFALAVACAVAAFYVAKAARDVSLWAREARQATIEQQAVLVTQAGDILTEVRGATTDVRSATQQATGVLSDLRTTTLPRVNALLETVDKTSDKLSAKIDPTSAEVDAILQHADAAVRTLDGTISIRSADIGRILGQLETISSNVAIVTAPDQVEPLVAELRAAGVNVNTATAHIAVIAANGETISADAVKVSNHYTEVLVPPPYHPTGNWFVRGMKRTGRVALRILQATPDLIVVGAKVL